MVYVWLLAGLALLFFGGEFLVRGSVGVARRLGLSELLIGLTLVGFGTSVPELVTSLQAVSEGAIGVAVGNVVGSNIANILLIIGVAALIAPIMTQPRAIARDVLVMVAATILLIALVWFDAFTRLTGMVLIAALLIYVVGSVILDRRGRETAALHEAEGEALGAPGSLLLGLVMAVGGIAGVVFGAKLLVENAVILARQFGVAETVIGLTIVAIGTSLPELATSVVAAMRGKADVSLGNVIGSNIFNIVGILGVAATVHPFSVSTPAGGGGSLLNLGDLGMLVLSAFMLILFALTGKRIARWEGLVLLAAYVAYMAFLFGAAR